jgi:hypothetical protein
MRDRSSHAWARPSAYLRPGVSYRPLRTRAGQTSPASSVTMSSGTALRTRGPDAVKARQPLKDLDHSAHARARRRPTERSMVPLRPLSARGPDSVAAGWGIGENDRSSHARARPEPAVGQEQCPRPLSAREGQTQ